MKKWIIVCLLGLSIGSNSCIKDDTCKEITANAPDAEKTTMDNYITTNNIIATKDDRGFYYKIDAAGADIKPSVCANVTVKYAGKLTNGTQFDANTTGLTFLLKNLITGWQAGIPLIGRGGKIKLYLPPSFGYGSAGSGSSIPGNSILIFDIELIDFN